MVEKQALDVAIMDLRKLSAMADYFVIATGSVDVHVRAIVDHVNRSLQSSESVKPHHMEGYSHMNWVLLDYGDIVVHVFQPDSREFYQLERLWGDAPVQRLEESVTSSD